MKSKATTYFLLALLLMVWGVILWRIFFSSESIPADQMSDKRPKTNEEDTVNVMLRLNYRDPFGVVDLNPKEIDRNNREDLTKTDYPIIGDVVYVGYVKNGGRDYCLIDIMGENYCLRVGDKASGVLLLSAHVDSIEVSKDGYKYILKRME